MDFYKFITKKELDEIENKMNLMEQTLNDIKNLETEYEKILKQFDELIQQNTDKTNMCVE